MLAPELVEPVREWSVVVEGPYREVYGIEDIRKLFKLYRLHHWTHDELKSSRITGMSTKRHKAGNDRQHRTAVKVAEAERLFLWLSNADPEAAATIYSHYVQDRSTADIADAEECSQRRIDYVINRGLKLMAENTGWVASGDAA